VTLQVTIEIKQGKYTGAPMLIVRVGDKEIARTLISTCDAQLFQEAVKAGIVPSTGYVQDMM